MKPCHHIKANINYEQMTIVVSIQYILKKYAHGFVVLCFVVVMQSFIMNSHEVFIRIHQGCFAGTGAIVSASEVSLMDLGKSVNV